MIHKASAALNPQRIFQRAAFRDAHADIIKALLLRGYRRVVIGALQKLRFIRDILLIFFDKSVPVSGKPLVTADPPFIDHLVIRDLLHCDLGVAFLKAFRMPFLMMEKRVLYGRSAAFFPKNSRSHAVMLTECGAEIGRAVAIIRPDLRDPALLLRL